MPFLPLDYELSIQLSVDQLKNGMVTSKMFNMVVRSANKKDLEKILEIEKNSFDYPWPKRAFKWNIGDEGCIFLVSEEEELVVGFIIASLDPMPIIHNINKVLKVLGLEGRFERVAHIQNLAVDPQFRRKGVASKLLNKSIEICSKKHIKHIRLEVRTNNQRAVSFYESHGFKRVKLLRSYYENGDDAYLMKKGL